VPTEPDWCDIARLSDENDSECHKFCGLLWADAICINQDDDIERAQQVGIMRFIYSQAKSVFIWLGNCEDNRLLTEAFSLLHAALNEYEKELLQWLQEKHEHAAQFNPSTEELTVEKNQRRGLPPLDAPEWRSLQWFFSNPWFSRVWILQEIALARSATVFLGDYEIVDLYRLGYVSDWFTRKEYNFEPGQLCKSGALDYLFDKSFHINVTGKRFELLRLLQGTRELGASLPEDRVYGLLGISSDINLESTTFNIVPDYSKSYPQIYRETTRLIVSCITDLDVLGEVVTPIRRVGTGWPTWVPDWTKDPTFLRFTMFSTQNFNACAGMPRQIDENTDMSILRLKGVGVDTITHCTPQFDSPLHSVPSLWGWTSKRLGPCTNLYLNGDTLGFAFTITVTGADTGYGLHPADDPDFMAEASNFWKSSLSRDLLNGNRRNESKRSAVSTTRLSAFQRSICCACTNRCFFITSKGYIGIGPSEMKPGDKVVVLLGGRTPFILRPCTPQRIGDEAAPLPQDLHNDGYLLVGDCYVHGMMKGEIMMREKGNEVFFDIR